MPQHVVNYYAISSLSVHGRREQNGH